MLIVLKIEVLVEYSYIQLKYNYVQSNIIYDGWNFNSGNYLFTTDTK